MSKSLIITPTFTQADLVQAKSQLNYLVSENLFFTFLVQGVHFIFQGVHFMLVSRARFEYLVLCKHRNQNVLLPCANAIQKQCGFREMIKEWAQFTGRRGGISGHTKVTKMVTYGHKWSQLDTNGHKGPLFVAICDHQCDHQTPPVDPPQGGRHEAKKSFSNFENFHIQNHQCYQDYCFQKNQNYQPKYHHQYNSLHHALCLRLMASRLTTDRGYCFPTRKGTLGAETKTFFIHPSNNYRQPAPQVFRFRFYTSKLYLHTVLVNFVAQNSTLTP